MSILLFIESSNTTKKPNHLPNNFKQHLTATCSQWRIRGWKDGEHQTYSTVSGGGEWKAFMGGAANPRSQSFDGR